VMNRDESRFESQTAPSVAHGLRGLALLAPGTRVRVRAPHALLTLRSPCGVVIRSEDSEEPGWYIIRLDHPAIYHDPIHGDLDVTEIRESIDNLDAAVFD
jgi:hypothetical protein